MTTLHFKVEMFHLLTWFGDSPDKGDPACLCSLCEKVIEDEELSLRIFHGFENLELRLHMNCAKQVIREFARTPMSQPGITYPRCGWTSYNPHDIE